MRRSALIVMAMLTLAAGSVAIIATGPRAMSKEPRFSQLTMDQLSDQQKPLAEQIMKISSVGIGGPYNPLLRSPVLGQRMFDLLHYLRWETSVPLKLNEFAILIIGRQWRSQVEWLAHAPLAIKAGLSPDIVTELKANKRPSNMPPQESAVYDFVTELTTKHAVSDETFNRAKELLGEQQVVDLTAVAGSYVAVAMLLAMSEAGRPARQGTAIQARRTVVSPGRKCRFGAGRDICSRHLGDIDSPVRLRLDVGWTNQDRDYGQRSLGRIQRRRYRHPYHHYGAGTEDPAWRRLGGARWTGSELTHLRHELRLLGNLLEQSSSSSAHRRRGSMGSSFGPIRICCFGFR